jgi:hypothetical protein
MASPFLFGTSLPGQDEAVVGGKIKNALWHKDQIS